MSNNINNMQQVCQRLLIDALQPLVDELFDRLDDELFKRAESAANDNHQRLFVDANRELKQKRAAIGSRFLNGLSEELDYFFTQPPGAELRQYAKAIRGERKNESLSLLQNAELEENLAVAAVVSKAENQLHDKLEMLTGLLASMARQDSLTEAEHPYSPEALTTLFRRALSVWNGDMLARKVVYGLFGEVVILQLEEFYQQLNDRLIAAGIEPLTRRTRIDRPERKARNKSAETTDDAGPRGSSIAGDRSIPDTSFEQTNIFNLVSMIRRVLDAERDALGLPEARSGYDRSWPVMGPADLMDAIQQVARRVENVSPFNLQAAQEANESFKQNFLQYLGQLAQSKHKQINAVDQHVIDVLILLFDFVLEDPLMPAPMKVLLSRLQIPMLRIALQDKKFLTDKEHPARQLLNNLSWSAIRWADNGNYSAASTYGLIEQAIDRIIREPEPDANLYAEVSHEFVEEIKHQESSATLSEERLRQVARGQEQLAEARARVDEVLAELMNEQIPVAVYRLLDEPWRDVLTLIYLREGIDSESWGKAIDLAKRLLDSVVPREKEWQRQKLMRDIPVLIADLREGFASISYDTAKSSHLLQQLQLCHIVVLRGQHPAEKFHPSELTETSSLMPDTELLPDQYDDMAQAVEEGQWLAWRLDGNEFRAKLSWRSEIADLMLFVDTMGRKVLEMTNEDLAELFRANEARVLYDIDVPMVERGLSVIYKALRSIVPDGSVTMRA